MKIYTKKDLEKIKKRKVSTTKKMFDFIVQYERRMYQMTGKEKIYPSSNLIQLVFGITAERVRQIYVQFENKHKVFLRETKVRSKKNRIGGGIK